MTSTESQKAAALRYYHKNKEKNRGARNEYMKQWRERNQEYLQSEEYKAGINGYKRNKRQEVQGFVRERKLELGCSECGYRKHHAALEWHHTDDNKETNVSFCLSMGAAIREMEKCIVLCSNCHKIHHWNSKLRDLL